MTRKVILLVEDNAIDEELMIRALRKARILNDVAVARDGAEAVDYVFSTGKHRGRVGDMPWVVLLDLNLPKLSGLEVLARIRANPRTTELPVVILTSSSERQDVLEGYRAGANSYVVKPVDSTEYCETVKRLGWYWLTVNVPLV